jgi:hypothetical protein
MNAISKTLALVIATGALASVLSVHAAEPTPAPAAATSPPAITVARSAQLTVDASEKDDSLTLRIRRAADQAPVNSSEVKVSIDGKNEPVTPQADGSYLISTRDLRGNGQRVLDVIVPHDGIREILTGKVALTEASKSTGLLGDHKQMAWWILNVAVVLVAAIALSRRRSS